MDPVLKVGAIAAALAAILTLAGLLWRGWRTLWREVIEPFREFLSDWRGEPAREGVPERPGVMRRLERVEHRLDTVVAEFRPNGGATLRDVVDDTRTKVGQLETAPVQVHVHHAAAGQ